MNLFRFFAYLLILALLVLAATLAVMLGQLVGGASLTPEIAKGLIILIVILLIGLLLVCFLLCLARAKDRKNQRQKIEDGRMVEVEPEIDPRKLRAKDRFRLSGICDVLVQRKFYRRCQEIPIKITRLPDPCIYSQFFLMENNQPVTWDNPDVQIFLNGVEQYTYDLAVSTTYQVRVSLRNNSPFFDAPGTQVIVNMLTFGIGGPTPTPITSFVIDIPAATVNPPVTHEFDWPSPETQGHYCIQVLLSHPDDINPGNNEGWNNTNVNAVAAGSAFSRKFPVWNTIDLPRQAKRGKDDAWVRKLSQITLTVDSYQLPKLDPKDANPDVLFQPQPALWAATVTPNKFELMPGEGGPVEVEFNVAVPPDAPAGTRTAFNITAVAGDRPLGGVTIYLDT